jgi:hypothetical protein
MDDRTAGLLTREQINQASITIMNLFRDETSRDVIVDYPNTPI